MRTFKNINCKTKHWEIDCTYFNKVQKDAIMFVKEHHWKYVLPEHLLYASLLPCDDKYGFINAYKRIVNVFKNCGTSIEKIQSVLMDLFNQQETFDGEPIKTLEYQRLLAYIFADCKKNAGADGTGTNTCKAQIYRSDIIKPFTNLNDVDLWGRHILNKWAGVAISICDFSICDDKEGKPVERYLPVLYHDDEKHDYPHFLTLLELANKPPYKVRKSELQYFKINNDDEIIEPFTEHDDKYDFDREIVGIGSKTLEEQRLQRLQVIEDDKKDPERARVRQMLEFSVKMGCMTRGEAKNKMAIWDATREEREKLAAKVKEIKKYEQEIKKTASGDFWIDLTKKAKEGKITTLVGRDKELDTVIRALNKKSSPNVLLLAYPGVGKTAIVEGLAKRIITGDVPESLKNKTVLAVNLGDMTAGTSFRGDFEERVKKLMKHVDKNTIVFIDEIHLITSAGSSRDDYNLNAGNLLKPYLANGELHCIGATTYDEYRNTIGKDKALVRRFTKIDLHEPSKVDTLIILKGIREEYEKFHGIKYSDDVLESIVELTDTYIKDRYFPDKAVAVLDEIGSKYKSIGKKGKATVNDVMETICSLANLPAKELHNAVNLKTLADDLKMRVFGQNDIIERLAMQIKLTRAGMKGELKPDTFLFVGNTGTGKTELAKSIAELLNMKLLTLDMSEYADATSVNKLIGSNPGYAGYEKGGILTEQVRHNPFSVVLLDEIEKADSSIFNLLLQVMDEGRLSDNNGDVTSFSNVILIMTSNVGCVKAENANSTIGFDCVSQKQEIFLREVNAKFSPEFRNRLTDIYYFSDLSEFAMGNVLNKEIRELNANLAKNGITVELKECARQLLIKQAVDAHLGARPVRRLVQKNISEQLVDAILDGLCNATVVFEVKNEQIVWH